MTEKKETPKEKGIREQTVTQILNLMTASFGLVAALAWNQFVQALIADYVKPIFGKNSGTISSLIYAVIVTVLAVIITLLASRFLKKD